MDIDLLSLENDIKNNPEIYSQWLKICYEKVLVYIKENNA